MRDISLLLLHLFVTVFRLAKPGGVRSVIAESVMLRHQLLILNRGRKRAPNLRFSDRLISGLCTLLMRPAAILRTAIVLKPSTLLRFHSALVKRKYRLLFSAKSRSKPGPKGPSKEVIDAILEMKRRNPIWGCPRIAQQITPVRKLPKTLIPMVVFAKSNRLSGQGDRDSNVADEADEFREIGVRMPLVARHGSVDSYSESWAV
jgi:hypothetical protein